LESPTDAQVSIWEIKHTDSRKKTAVSALYKKLLLKNKLRYINKKMPYRMLLYFYSLRATRRCAFTSLLLCRKQATYEQKNSAHYNWTHAKNLQTVQNI